MQKIHAILHAGENEAVFDVEPLVYGNTTIYGQKAVKYKDVPLTDDEIKKYTDAGMPADMIPKTKQMVDDSQPVRYDEITAMFMDNQSLKNINGQLMLENAKNKSIIGKLMLDSSKNKVTIAGLMTEISKLKMQMMTNNGGNK